MRLQQMRNNYFSAYPPNSWAALVCLAVILGGILAPKVVVAETLDEVLSHVYSTSPVLNNQRVQLRATNEKYPQAISNWLPSVSYTRTGTKTVAREKGNSTGTTNTEGVDDAISLSMDIFRGGRNFVSFNKAKIDIEGGREQLIETEQTVFLDAITAYMDVLRDQETVEIRRNNINVLNKHFEAVQVQYDLRRRTETDLAQARSRLLAAEALTAVAEAKLIATENRFQRVVGLPPEGLSFPKDSPDALKVNDDNARDLISENPAIRKQQHAVESAEADVDLSAGELLPSVALSSSITRSKSALRNASATVGQSGVVSMTLTVPIYQKGAVYSRLRESKYTLGSQKLTLNQTYRTTIESLLSNADNLRVAKVRISSLQAQVEAAEIALQSIEAELEVGRRTVLDVLDQEQELLNARLNLVSAERDRIVFAYTIERDIGQLTANDLGIAVDFYDTQADFDDQKLNLLGTGTLPELPNQR